MPFTCNKMGTVLVEEAGGKGLQSSMDQQGRPLVYEGGCHGVLHEAGWLSALLRSTCRSVCIVLLKSAANTFGEELRPTETNIAVFLTMRR